jgi:biopolymer transport protein ExbD
MQPGIKVNLPKAVTSEVVKEDNLIIVISRENIAYINNNVWTAQEIKSYLSKGNNSQRPILIKADKRASLGRVVEIWDLCREMGISQVNIATDQE